MTTNNIATQLNLYGKKIILTLETILKDLGANNILIDDIFMRFSVNDKQKTINIRDLTHKILDSKENITLDDILYQKTLKEIERMLKSL